MNKFRFLLTIFTLLLLISCNNKKYTEVVEVPLPAAEEKLTIGNPDDVKADEGMFEMKKLPYKYDDLIPSLDAATMEIHYSKHYLTYTNNLNKILKEKETSEDNIENILATLDMNDLELRNNAGGYYNHGFFFEGIIPKGGGEPKDSIAASISRDFGSFENFESVFKTAAQKQFGSGWAWLITDKNGKLQVIKTPNQDNPLMGKAEVKGIPLLNIDVWEHAYYLKFQYRRASYIDAFFDVINWKKVEERYLEAIKK